MSQRIGLWFTGAYLRLTSNERGATAAEYAIILALVAVAIVGGLVAFRNEIRRVLEAAVAALQAR